MKISQVNTIGIWSYCSYGSKSANDTFLQRFLDIEMNVT